MGAGYVRIVTAGLLLCVVLLGVALQPGSLQAHEPLDEPGTMLIEFLLPAEAPADLDAYFNERFGVFAGGQRCVPFNFTDPGWTDFGDHVGSTAVIGRPDQPASCHEPGARLRFGDGARRWLATETAFEAETLVAVADYRRLIPAGLPGTGSGGLADRGFAAKSARFTPWFWGGLAATMALVAGAGLRARQGR